MKYQEFFIYNKNMPGFNEIINSAKIVTKRSGTNVNTGYSNMKRRWTDKIRGVIIEENIYPVDKIFLHMLWFEPTKRRDPDNITAFTKFILDALQKAGTIKNDGWAQIKGLKNTFEIGPNRGVRVRILDAEKYKRASDR